MRPSAVELFALYHLGLDREGRYRFRNLSDCARIYGVEGATVLRWLQADGADPDTVSHVDFNLTRWHVDAQFVQAEDAPTLIAKAWNGYCEALARRDPSRVFHDVDYDDIWGDGAKPGDDSDPR